MNQRSSQPSARIRRKEWLFRLSALVLVPLAFFGAAEVALRLAGYGYDASFFTRKVIGNPAYLGENERFSLRFFPPALARTPEPISMTEQKPEDVSLTIQRTRLGQLLVTASRRLTPGASNPSS